MIVMRLLERDQQKGDEQAILFVDTNNKISEADSGSS
jgi:hypothetical protein